MTKEQEEAIEYLEQFIGKEKEYKHKPIKIKTLPNTKNAIEIVLNMLKDLQKENKYMHSELDRQQTTINNYAKEIEKKDKIIDLMVKAMDKIQDTQVCKYCDNKINLNHGYCVDAGKCKEGIKQYFKEIAERKSE